MAKECVKKAWNEAKVEADRRTEANKKLGVAEQQNKELTNSLTILERACLSAEVGLKNVVAQAEDQRKLLHLTEIDLATQRQLVLDLKSELQKVKETAQVTRDIAKAEKAASYECRVLDTETRLVEEVVGVCKDYCAEVWAETLNQIGVPATSELRRAENIFFPEDSKEDPTMLPPSTTLPLSPPEQPPTIQAPSLDAEVLTGAVKNKENVIGGPQPEGEDKGKGVQPPTEDNPSEDALTIKDVVCLLTPKCRRS